ncbi:DUF4142 domain-containing protein [Rufibacter radiotolerans]|nr:DUF4142 domain-containing protein [Rufibacter radiotolerans]
MLRTARAGKALLLACLVWAVTSCATTDMGGSTGGSGTGTGATSTAQADQAFIETAAGGQQLRLRLSEVAVQKTANLEAREFAKAVVTNHTKSVAELKGIAQQLRVTYPMALPSGRQAVYDRVTQLTGSDFDRAFAREMELAYQQDIALYQNSATAAGNLALRGFIIKTTPVLQGQLRLATQLKNILP